MSWRDPSEEELRSVQDTGTGEDLSHIIVGRHIQVWWDEDKVSLSANLVSLPLPHLRNPQNLHTITSKREIAVYSIQYTVYNIISLLVIHKTTI